jgi:hypothetical protein
MGKQCRKIFGQSLLDELGEERVLRIEQEIQRKINDLSAHPDGIKNIDNIDASRIGGPSGETGLQYIARQVLEKEIIDTKQIWKTKFVEANKVTTEIDEIKKSIKFFLDVYGKEGRSGLARFFVEAGPIAKALGQNNYAPLIDRILMGRMFESNYTRGLSLEKIKQSTFGMFWAQMIDKKLSNDIGHNWYRKHATKKDNIISILDDLIAIQKDPTRTTSVKNSNTPQYQIVKAFRDSFERMMKENNMVGGKMNFFNLMPKPRINPNKVVTKAQQQLAIKDFADALDDQVVFNLTDIKKSASREVIESEKLKIATEEIDRVVNSGTDKNAFGIETGKNKDYLIFKDGASLYKIYSKYTTENDFVGMMFRQMNQLTEQHALTKLTGARPLQYLRTLEDAMRNDATLSKFVNSNGFKIYQRTIRALVEPRPIGKNNFVGSINSVRNIQLLKLGFVPVDQLLIEPIFAFLRMRKATGLFNLIGNIGPLQGRKKKLSARFHNVAMEKYIGAINNRLYGSLSDSFSDGAVTGFTSKVSNFFIKWTGATWLSDGQAAAGFAVFRMDVTEAFKKGIYWKNLRKKKPDFVYELQKAGIDEQMWDQAMRGFKDGKFKGEDGLFDPGLLDMADTKLRSRGVTDYDAWMAYFQKRVDGYSRMRPGQLETERLKFHTDSEVMGSILKTLTQFKSFTMSIGRRMYGDANLRGGKLAVLQTAAYMMPGMLVGALLSSQAREILKGNAPLKWGPDLWGRAWSRSGISGWGSVVFFDDLVEDTINAFYPETKKETSRSIGNSLVRDILGPGFTEIIDNISGISSSFLTGIRSLTGDPKADFGKSAFYTLRDLLGVVSPNGFPMSLFIQWLMYDTLEKSFYPEIYYKREKRNTKKIIDQRSKGSKNFVEWIENF